MKILLGGDCDNGGGSWWLADAINRHTKHRARAVRGYQSYLQYDYDILAPTTSEMRRLVKWADVIHIRERLPKTSGGIPEHKPVVVTYTGRVFRKCSPTVYEVLARGWVICVVTPDMMAFCPDVNPIWLPNPREAMPHLWNRTKKFSLCQAPTSRQGKQTDKVIEAAKRAGVRLYVIENIPYKACILRKGRAWVTIDQFKYGYGNNAIEGWAMGMPVISGFFPGPYREALKKTCGGEIPFAEARPRVQSIQAVIERLRDDPAYYQEYQERGRDHFYAYHHGPVVAARAIEVYRMAMDKKK